MRIWVIVFLAGAALVALHLSASIVLSQSYGDNALVWSDLMGIFFVSIALGLVLGTPLANKFRAAELLFVLSLISGILVFMLPWLAPRLQNLLLTKNMGPHASSILFSAALVLPASILLATIAPAAWKIRSIVKSKRKGSSKKKSNPADREAAALKWFFFTLSLGAVAGSFATLVVLPIVGHWGFLNAIAILLVVIAFLGLSLHIKFLVTFIVGIQFFFVSVTYEELIPVEALLKASEYVFEDNKETQSDDFRKKKFLTYAEVRKTFGAMRAKIVEATDKSIGIKLVVDSLEKLGNVAISGSDFEKVYCEMITDPDVLAQTIPFVKRIRLIESDGFGRIYFQIRRIKGSAQATLVIPQKKGFIKLLFKSHFTLTISRKGETHTNMAIGPVNIVEGGLFSASKSYYTPVIAVDAVGPFDVTLVFLDIHNEEDRVRITVSGQGFIGGLKTKEIANLEK
jgi:MFS family permease